MAKQPHQDRAFGRIEKPDARNENFLIRGAGAPNSLQLPTKPVIHLTCIAEDQKQTPHCVGYCSHHFLRSEPHYDYLRDLRALGITGDEIYYDCKIIDNEPKAEDGTNANSAMKVLRAEGLITSWNWATTPEEVANWLGFKGPLMFGMNWHTSMDQPDKAAKVSIAGQIRGGHEFLGKGIFPDPISLLDSWVKCLNSWGLGYGQFGNFYIKLRDLMTLLDEGGDICAPVKKF
jgi:hypothetical protein